MKDWGQGRSLRLQPGYGKGLISASTGRTFQSHSGVSLFHCIRWQDFLGALIVLIAGLSTLIGALTAGLDPSLVGLAVTYVLQVSAAH